MGQDVAPMNLDAFKNARPAQAFQTLNPADDNLAEGIGSSYGIIGYKGKVWSLRYRGERHNFVRPDDGSPISYIDVIILRQAHAKSKSFYEKFDQAQSEGSRPICSSLNGIVPDADAAQPQAQACAICPRNTWKVDAQGRKGRECTDYKRLAVLLLPNQTKAVLGQALMEPVFLRVPPASLNDLAVMGETMSNQGWHYSAYITRISFDPNQAHPKMLFRPLQGLSDKEAPVILPLRDDPMALRITGEDQVATETTRLTQTPATPAVTHQAPPPAQQPTAQVIELQAHQQVRPAAPQVQAPPPPAEPVSTGLLELTANPQPAVAQTQPQRAPLQPVQPPVSDVGEPQESDAMLDARVSELLKSV